MALFKRSDKENPAEAVDAGEQAQDETNGNSAAETTSDAQEVLTLERIRLLRERDEFMRERDELRAELARQAERGKRLEAEIERYRSHAQRTSKLFLHATDYAAWLRGNARRDAELALSKARARAEEIVGDAVRERQRAERELVRLQELASQTRERIKELTLDALRLLDAPSDEKPATPEPEPQRSHDDLEHVLRQGLPSSGGESPRW